MTFALRRVFVALSFFVSMAPLVASADPETTVIVQPKEPVHIDACSVAGPTKSGSMQFTVDFTNVAAQPVTDVEFVFVMRDLFDHSVVGRGVAHGTYAPNVRINGGYKNGYRANSPSYSRAFCTISGVIYADGTRWQAGKGFLKDAAAPASSPAPAPAPTPTP